MRDGGDVSTLTRADVERSQPAQDDCQRCIHRAFGRISNGEVVGQLTPGVAVSFRADTASPVTDPATDLTVALVRIGHNGSIWAQNLPVQAPTH